MTERTAVIIAIVLVLAIAVLVAVFTDSDCEDSTVTLVGKVVVVSCQDS